MKQFIKKDELQLINGGYLVNKEGTPVSHDTFVYLQNRAHYIATFAKHAKGKDFKGKEAYSLQQLKNVINEELYSKKSISFIESPKSPVGKLTTQLKNEALAFMDFQEGKSKIDKINEFMQEFALLAEFEEFGLFFTEDIVKLNKIYTIEEILENVKEIIELV